MANFIPAYNMIMKYEGSYNNDPVDIGGETYKGISRVYNPTWKGWKIIDELKEKSDFPKNLLRNWYLNQLVKLYFKKKYWDPLLLDDIMDQEIAEKLFDISVNMGTHRSSVFLQQALNYLNRNQMLYLDLVEDGKVGKKTLGALKVYLEYDKPNFILKVLNLLQGNHYLSYMKRSPKQEKFARGWLNRITIK